MLPARVTVFSCKSGKYEGSLIVLSNHVKSGIDNHFSDMAVFRNLDVGIVCENGLKNANEKITFLRMKSKRFK